MNTLYYFGCWAPTKGHFLFKSNGYTAYDVEHKTQPFKGHLDGFCCPGFAGLYKTPDEVQKQGDAQLNHLLGWTYVALWDRSVDGRGMSNCGFLVEGLHTFEEVMAEARDKFRTTMKRLDEAGGVRLVHYSLENTASAPLSARQG